MEQLNANMNFKIFAFICILTVDKITWYHFLMIQKKSSNFWIQLYKIKYKGIKGIHFMLKQITSKWMNTHASFFFLFFSLANFLQVNNVWFFKFNFWYQVSLFLFLRNDLSQKYLRGWLFCTTVFLVWNSGFKIPRFWLLKKDFWNRINDKSF